MADREPLSGLDNVWRRMSRPDNLVTITGVLTFADRLPYDRLCDRLESRLLRFDRFTQHVGGRKRWLLGPYWEPAEGFDVHNHVYDLALPEPADEAAFQRFVGTLMSRPLDESRPLWEMYLLDNAGPDGGNAVVVRIDHSIGDGFALLSVMLGLVDDPEQLEFPVDAVPPPPAPPGSDRPDIENADKPAQLGQRVGGSGPLGTAARLVGTAYDLLTMGEEPETSLQGPLGPTKRVAWTRRFDLDRVKALGRAHDATVNDVLLAVTAGAVRRVLDGRGEETAGLELRWTVPVNLAAAAERTGSLGNHFGVAFVPLPVGTREFGARIERVREQMDTQTAGMQAVLTATMLGIAGRLPESVQSLGARLFDRAATGIVTNVPGPTGAARLAGTEIRDMIFWVPQARDQGVGISLVSYNGGVRVGVAGDANLLPDPDVAVEAFESELDRQFESFDA